jgi:mitochondrial inner membrane protease ATP23
MEDNGQDARPIVDRTPHKTKTWPDPSTHPELPPNWRELNSWSHWWKIQRTKDPAEQIQQVSELRRVRNILNEERDCRRCEKWRDKMFDEAHSPIVAYLAKEIKSIGPEIGPHNVRCKRCVRPMSGAFDDEYGILLCANRMTSKKELEDTLAHEMVHAYDSLRWKVERWNLKHQACTEVILFSPVSLELS